MENKFTFIDLFAGIGGIRLGFERAGGKCVFSSEIDKFARQTYQANFGEYPAGDITKIDAKDIPSFDILTGGFPCQSFSRAGKRLGFDDPRGNLFFEIIRIAEFHRPKVIFLENVDSIQHYLPVISKSIEVLGYVFHWKYINSDQFVPQNRSRIYMIALRKDIKYRHDLFGWNNQNDMNVGSILQEFVDDKYTLSDKLWNGHLRRKEEHLKKGNGFGFRTVSSESRRTSTLTARYGKDGSEILIKQDGKNPRKLTPRECARLQGFSDSFIIPVSDTQAYKQFGNSVTVPVIEEIAKNIANNL